MGSNGHGGQIGGSHDHRARIQGEEGWEGGRKKIGSGRRGGKGGGVGAEERKEERREGT